MEKKYKNKYRIESARLKTWNYSQKAKYHITFCTHLMQHFFGIIKNEEMIYSPEGKTALENLTSLSKKFPFLILDEFQIMPNHIHAIFIINDKPVSSSSTLINFNEININPSQELPNNTNEVDLYEEDNNLPHLPFLQNMNDFQAFEKSNTKSGGVTGNNNPMLHENLSTCLRFFKAKATFEIRKLNKSFKWHPRFHDTIIRNNAHYENVRKYIKNNIKNWKK